MAKKKSTHQKKQPDPLTQTHQNSSSEMEKEQDVKPSASMGKENGNPSSEDSKEKISNLKSLNVVLLKETVEKRQEISALLESKKSLQTELTRSASEVEMLRDALSQMRKEDGVEEEVMKEVISVFVGSQVVGSMKIEKEEVEKRLKEVEREMSVVVKERDEIEKLKFEGDCEIGSMKKTVKELRAEIQREKENVKKVVSEKNEIRDELGLRVEELNGLKKKIAEVEAKEKTVIEEFAGLMSKYKVSTKAVEDKEKEIKLMMNELSLMRKDCEDLKREIEGNDVLMGTLAKGNADLCDESRMKNVRIDELEKEVGELKLSISSVKMEEEKWRVKFFDLEKSNAGVLAELELLKADLSRLLKEKKEKEGEIESLSVEKSTFMVKLNEFEETFKGSKRIHQEIIDEKVRLEEVKLFQQKEISELQNELNEFRGKVALLQESNRVYAEKTEKLSSEIDDHSNALARVSNERDEVKKALDKEKKNGKELQVKVSDISKQMEDSAKVIRDLRAVSDTLLSEKKEIETNYSKLLEDKELIEKQSVLAKGKIAELETSMKSKTEKFELTLDMIWKTVAQLSTDNEKNPKVEGKKVKKRDINGEKDSIIAELEAMKWVFRAREAKVVEMQKQMENLQCCLMEVSKKKSLWRLLSSATTILAAVASIAYASSSSSRIS